MRQRDKVKVKTYNTHYMSLLRQDVLRHYGSGNLACVICGESRMLCLSIDHIDGSGLEHRRQIGLGGTKIGGTNFYRWLQKEGYPEGFRTLCMNCQCIKYYEKRKGKAIDKLIDEGSNND